MSTASWDRVELRLIDGEPLHWFDVRDDDGEGLAIGSKIRLLDANASLELGVAGEVGSLFSVSAQVTASHRFIPYAEVYALVDWRDHANTVLAMDAGLVMVVVRRLSFDFAARADVVAEQPAYGVLGGLSVILADGISGRSRSRRRPRRP